MEHKNNKTNTFQDIKAWQLAREFRKEIYGITKNFSKEELYCLTNQIKRAAISIHSNIAEGYGRYNFQENIQFCRIARGSTDEVLDQLFVALDEKYISEDVFNDLTSRGVELKKAINGYTGFLQNQKNKF